MLSVSGWLCRSLIPTATTPAALSSYASGSDRSDSSGSRSRHAFVALVCALSSGFALSVCGSCFSAFLSCSHSRPPPHPSPFQNIKTAALQASQRGFKYYPYTTYTTSPHWLLYTLHTPLISRLFVLVQLCFGFNHQHLTPAAILHVV